MSRTRPWVARRDRGVAASTASTSVSASQTSWGNRGSFSGRNLGASCTAAAASPATLLRPTTFHYQGLASKDAEDNTVAGGHVIDRSEHQTFSRKTEEEEEEEEVSVHLTDEVEHDEKIAFVWADAQASGFEISSQHYQGDDSEDDSEKESQDDNEHSEAELCDEDADALVAMTNLEASRRRTAIDGWKPMGRAEFRPYVGLLILAGVYSLWDAESGRSVFRATMPLKTFRAYSSALRFGDRETREARRRNDHGQYDKLAPVRAVWDEWCGHLPLMYRPGPGVTVDERLVPFRGSTCPANRPGTWKMQVYAGKPDKLGPPEKNLAARMVMDLTEGLASGRNVICDNFFTLRELAKEATHCWAPSEPTGPRSPERRQQGTRGGRQEGEAVSAPDSRRDEPRETPVKRQRCRVCPRSNDVKTKIVCFACRVHVCSRCVLTYCPNCAAARHPVSRRNPDDDDERRGPPVSA
ncbi:unnamed protein product [Oreochromis niloticus]|nr:unnamed protein product [Mustela putorius furo]